MIQIKLDTVRKDRNAKEWRNVNRASCGEHQRVGDGDNITKLCGDLIEAGRDPQEVVEIRRGQTVCFTPATLEQWATGNVGRKEAQPEWLKRGEQ